MEQQFSQPHTGAPDYEYDPADYNQDLRIYMERLLQDLFIFHYQGCSSDMRKHLTKAAKLRGWDDILNDLKRIDHAIS
jgi:hypothetical protein